MSGTNGVVVVEVDTGIVSLSMTVGDDNGVIVVGVVDVVVLVTVVALVGANGAVSVTGVADANEVVSMPLMVGANGV